jgi:hypothetical protein
MHFIKTKNHLVIILFTIALSICAVSTLTPLTYAYQNSDSSCALNLIEDEPIPEHLAKIHSEIMGEILAEVWSFDCADIYILAKIFDVLYEEYPFLGIGIIRAILWGVWDICLLNME